MKNEPATPCGCCICRETGEPLPATDHGDANQLAQEREAAAKLAAIASGADDAGPTTCDSI